MSSDGSTLLSHFCTGGGHARERARWARRGKVGKWGRRRAPPPVIVPRRSTKTRSQSPAVAHLRRGSLALKILGQNDGLQNKSHTYLHSLVTLFEDSIAEAASKERDRARTATRLAADNSLDVAVSVCVAACARAWPAWLALFAAPTLSLSLTSPRGAR